ncbi:MULTISPECIES: hypothetical protein [unclassified Streptomyces]|nr:MULTISPECIES: hypothetical protein [unclassified Streptomyces]MCX5153488.1 hypothetical protein [Streptomyces sp. NBC_00291]
MILGNGCVVSPGSVANRSAAIVGFDWQNDPAYTDGGLARA